MDYRAQIEAIRGQYLRGEITLDEAKVKVQPFLNEMNVKGEKISKEYGRKFKKFTFSYVMR